MKNRDLLKEIDDLYHPGGAGKLHGWCSREKAHAMARIILEYRPLVSVEIGVFGGSSLVPQALACDYLGHGHVYGVDPWSVEESLRDMQDTVNLQWWSGIDHEAIYRSCLSTLLEFRLTPHCTIFRTTSMRAHWLFDEIDVLHIDGNHTEQSSTSDVFTYLPKVSSGGHIWFDDVDWKVSTRHALDIVEERCERVLELKNKEGGTACALYRKR